MLKDFSVLELEDMIEKTENEIKDLIFKMRYSDRLLELESYLVDLKKEINDRNNDK